jgi:L-lactate dehydrogenase complex protein LldF
MNAPPAILHPELLAQDGGDTIVRDGRRLDHAEAASEPLRSRPEPQPRGAKVHGRRPIDQAEAAARFIAAPEHEKMHDERLWDLRQKRDREMHGIAEWEELRSLASAIKEHTLSHLDQYLEQFEDNARSHGVHVHWARDAAEHNQIVHGILRDHGAKSLIKSKSMLTEECGLRQYMASVGIEVIETDLGERIQQLDNEDPSHVVVPAVHKLRTDVAEVFAKTIGIDPANSDVHYLAEAQREATRPLILAADAGMTGCNFAIAETGTFVVCTNEGNADLSANVPKLHIASIGIEKIIPGLEHLAVFVRLLSRSALGSPVTQYTSHFRGPRDGGEMHIVLVDNGRSERLGLEEFWTSLKCIRCGACMNTCPVYRRSGGLSYGATYSGPIGLIIDPTFNQRKYTGRSAASCYPNVWRQPAALTARCLQRECASHGRDVSRPACLRRSAGAGASEDRGRQSRVLDSAGDRGQPRHRQRKQTTGSGGCRFRDRPRFVRRRRDRLRAAQRRGSSHKCGGVPRAAPDRVAGSRRHCRQLASRLPPARIPRAALRSISYRAVRDCGHRRCADPRRPGRAFTVSTAGCACGRQPRSVKEEAGSMRAPAAIPNVPGVRSGKLSAAERSALNQALAKALAFRDAGKMTEARQWAAELVRLLKAHDLST